MLSRPKFLGMAHYKASVARPDPLMILQKLIPMKKVEIDIPDANKELEGIIKEENIIKI